MNTKHTPGPWRIVPRKDLRGNTVGHEVRGRNTNSKSGENILFVSPDSSIPEAYANARLIAHAPDLLDACIEAEDTFQAFADAVGFAEMGPECHAALEALRAVLQKVRNG